MVILSNRAPNLSLLDTPTVSFIPVFRANYLFKNELSEFHFAGAVSDVLGFKKIIILKSDFLKLPQLTLV